MNQSWVYMCSPSWTHLPPLSPSHSSGSSQCTSPEHPVSCIEPGLEICFTYDTIHVSMLFSQIIPPSPSPTESKRLFYTSVSLLLSRNSIYCFRLLRTFYQMLHKDDMSTVVMIWFWILWEKVRVGWFERIVLKHIYYHMWNRPLVQVWCMKQGTQS